MTTHTPGPWGVRAKGQKVAEIVRCDDEQANARLIAAAPELLEALTNLVARINHNGGIGAYTGGPIFVMLDARAAIAKATGG